MVWTRSPDNDGDYIFSEAEFRRAVETTDKWLEECIARHQNDSPLTEAEEKEAEEAVAGCFAWLDEKFKDGNAKLVNPVHVQRLVALEGKP